MKYKFIGWCTDGKHDKVWGAIDLGNGQILTVWGRRGAKLQTKIACDNWDLRKLIDSKENKGYRFIDKSQLDEVYPNFESDLEKTAIWAALKI